MTTWPLASPLPVIPARRLDGFTLVELLVAMLVFSIMATSAYSGLSHVLMTRATVEQQNRRLAAIQMAMVRLEQDVGQATARSIRDDDGELQPALQGGALLNETLTLTRSGWDNPLAQTRSTLQRVAYRLRDGRLWRLHWEVLDRGGPLMPRETLLLEQVRDFSARFLDQANEWHGEWPTLHSSRGADDRPPNRDLLPRAVEITLTLEDWGVISRLLPLPG